MQYTPSNVVRVLNVRESIRLVFLFIILLALSLAVSLSCLALYLNFIGFSDVLRGLILSMLPVGSLIVLLISYQVSSTLLYLSPQVCLILCAFALILTPFTKAPSLLGLLQLIRGIAVSILWTYVEYLILVLSIDESTLKRNISLYAILFSVGFSIGAAVGVELFKLNFTLPFIISGILLILILPYAFRLRKLAENINVKYVELLTEKKFLPLLCSLLCAFSYGSLEGLISAHIIVYLKVIIDMTYTGLAVLLFSVFLISPLLAYIMLNIAKSRVMSISIASICILISPFLIELFLNVHVNTVTRIVSATILGAIMALIYMLGLEILAKVLGRELTGGLTKNLAYIVSYNIGIIVGTVLMGLVIQLYGWSSLWTIVISLLITGLTSYIIARIYV